MQGKPSAIFLMGPTASGKTALAMRLYQHLPCEIISVDSVLIYRGMDIGSAKPTKEELAQAPHHLLDMLDPAENYSVAQFRHDALKLMAEITARGRIPLLVGGTMMYFNILYNGMSEVPNADPAIRTAILNEAESVGWQAMHEQLQAVDPVSAARIHPNDPQRLQRALEVYRGTGMTMTEWRIKEQQQRQAFPYHTLQIAVAPDDRAVVHKRIEKRFDGMLSAGFEQEVRKLYQRGDLHADMPSIRAVGYRQMWAYLDGEYDWVTMREKGIAASRQLAKRQFTWLRSWPELTWLYSTKEDEKKSTHELLDRWQENVLKLVNQTFEKQF